MYSYVNTYPLVLILNFDLLVLRIMLPQFYQAKTTNKEIKMVNHSQLDLTTPGYIDDFTSPIHE